MIKGLLGYLLGLVIFIAIGIGILYGSAIFVVFGFIISKGVGIAVLLIIAFIDWFILWALFHEQEDDFADKYHCEYKKKK